ncbi:MAG: RNA-binding protein [Candidatus Nezhaarchaeota archaeon]|nr:RNA-binding protein [Candidatus Nezhaarchaeota archaeon]
MSKPHRFPLSKSEAKKLVASIKDKLRFKCEIDHKSKWEYMNLNNEATAYFMNGEPLVLMINNFLVPSLMAMLKGLVELPRIVVDMGAVKHVVNGADVMIPGIVKVEEDFSRDEVVVVVDEKYGKPLCVGSALLSSSEIRAAGRGRAIKNLHHVGDKVWSRLKEFFT